ncbi:anaerobic typically selenocysteine-containing protein [Methylorubrum populi]|uniref:Anaerobic typically selenocysteine-containing protein n=1 Tax=Methylorubrum rhodesianum TaxID=29427 RepID=A0ABU9ZIR6_9HYPH|nr:anaerobic typically selenocysteine-containing protein [Methylorubrum rhodesianum]MBK3401871.1 anaerobic typically selenocysteine-containing protein [Methylorubrum rhodesianum]MBY0141137.1 anaerobic typically selenocysteine-containing protein [Methylorubrum populi]
MSHRSTRLRIPAILLAAVTGLALPAAAHAEGQAGGKPLPPPASDAMPPVELTVEMRDGHPVCQPAELRLPADTNVALNVVSRADQPVTITMPGQFENGRVLHADGDLVHVASEKGYTVKREGRGQLRLRTVAAGEKAFACTGANSRSNPFEDKVILTPPAG